ncbi:MAG: hypothetical protein V3U98_00710 [Acidobacteriota bacterium]
MHVPGWHEKTRKWQQEGRLQVLGIIEEQHPERARLFMQWKRMDWPILVDSLNLLRVPYVPITLAIDEHGVIRLDELGLEEVDRLEKEFLDRTFELPAGAPPGSAPAFGGTVRPDLGALGRAASRLQSAAAWREHARALVLWGGTERHDEAIEAYHEAVRLEPGDDATRFRLGVAYRMRHDSERRQSHDFQSAVNAWSEALEIDPNNYIWRRRIQQYGPRLDKPYSFYDWVSEAREEIEARGETPVPLRVEPGGAELAYPAERFASEQGPSEAPDPQGHILRDKKGFIQVETVLVPPAIAPGGSARVHVIFRPNADVKAHWNNEVEDLVFWVDPPAGWRTDRRWLTVPRPQQVVSTETRRVEFELQVPADAAPGTVELSGYALYYVCEDVKGTCLYRRQDLSLQIAVLEQPR